MNAVLELSDAEQGVGLMDLFEMADLQHMQDLFAKTTGVASVITLPTGEPLTCPGNFCELCLLVRSTEVGLANCLKSDAQNCSLLTETVYDKVTPCLSAGLWDAGIKIVVDGHHLANWLVGQVRTEDMTREKMLNYAAEIGVDYELYQALYDKVPVVKEAQFVLVIEMLQKFVNDLSERAFLNYKLQKEIKEKQMINEQVKKSELRYKELLNNLNSGVVLHAPDTSVILCNTKASCLLGLDTSAMTGKDAESEEWDFVDEHGAKLPVDVYPVTLVQRTLDPVRSKVYGIKKTGGITWVNVNGMPVFTEEGTLREIIISFEDITEQVVAGDRLVQSQQLLEEAQKIAGLGNVVIDFVAGTWAASDILCEIAGLDSNRGDMDSADWKQIIYPEYCTTILDTFGDITEGRLSEINLQLKIRRPSDGVDRWLHIIGETKKDVRGRVLKVILTIQDITESKLAKVALQNSEALYRSILQASPDVIVVVDLEGIITMVSPLAVTMAGCRCEDDLVGLNMYELIAEVDKPKAREYAVQMLSEYLGAVEYQIVRANGDVFEAEVNGNVIYDESNCAVGMVFIVRDITERKRSELLLQESQQKIKEFAAHLQSVREEERVVLAREIHDDLGQMLVAIKLELGLLERRIVRNSKDDAQYQKLVDEYLSVMSMVDKTIDSARRIMSGLRPDVLDIVGLVDAISLYVQNFQNKYKIFCLIESNVTTLSLQSEQTIALYRIVQETFANIARHAQASTVRLKMEVRDGKFCMTIEDDGVGFDEASIKRHSSFGMLGMQERAHLLDGKLKIQSTPGSGTKVTIEMSYNK